jgi:hypothetical protein
MLRKPMGFPYRQKGYAGSVAVSDMFLFFARHCKPTIYRKCVLPKGSTHFL